MSFPLWYLLVSSAIFNFPWTFVIYLAASAWTALLLALASERVPGVQVGSAKGALRVAAGYEAIAGVLCWLFTLGSYVVSGAESYGRPSTLLPWILLGGTVLIRLSILHPMLRANPSQARSDHLASSLAIAAASGLGWHLLVAPVLFSFLYALRFGGGGGGWLG